MQESSEVIHPSKISVRHGSSWSEFPPLTTRSCITSPRCAFAPTRIAPNRLLIRDLQIPRQALTLTSFVLLFMPSPTASKFAFVSSSHIYLFPIVLIPAYSCSPSLIHCSLIPLDLIVFTLAHVPSSSPRIAPLPSHVDPVPDHASCAGVLSLSCNAIVVTEYGSCHRSQLLSLITALVRNYCPYYGFSFLSRLLVLVTYSHSCYGFSSLSWIPMLVKASRYCHGLSFLS